MGYINVPGSANIGIIKGDQLSSDQITLKNLANEDARVSINDYIFINENCSLILDNPSITIVDYTGTTKQINSMVSSLAYNSGRKVVRLSNGWIIVAVTNTATAYMYKSEDEGATWSLLTSLGADSGLNGGHIAIASSGTRLYLLLSMPITKAILMRSYDALNPSVGFVQAQIYSSMTEASSGIAITVGPDGVLHATWACKNGSYANSFNIMYSKSTNADHSTWATPTQVSTANSTTTHYTQPTIIINSSNRPVIIFAGNESTSKFISIAIYNGSTWQFPTVYTGNQSNYIQENPSVAMDSNNNLHLVWEGYTSGTAAKNILYAVSTDGGGSWSGATLLTSGNTRMKVNASISINQNNDITVVFSGVTDTTPSYYQLHHIKKPSGGSWSSVTVYTVRTGNTVTGVSMIEKDTSNADIPIVAFSGDNDYLRLFGKWNISNSPQEIKSVVNATSADKFKALGDGVLKSLGSIPKMYNGFISKTDLGFTTL